MISIIAEKIIDFLDKNNCLKEDKEIYIYGAKLFVSTCIGTGLLLMVGLITNHLMEAIIYEVVISSSRSIMGGYHAKSYTGCIGSFVGIFLMGLIWLNYHIFSFEEILIISVMSIIITAVLSPVENVNKVLSENKKKHFKVYSVIYTLVYIVSLLSLYYVRNQYVGILIYGLLIINILTIGGKIDYEKVEK